MKNYYNIIGIDKKANNEEIKKAYRKLALKYHPDRNQGDKKAEEKFKEINEAYSILSNSQKRSNYDRYSSSDGQRVNFGADFRDIFSDFNNPYGSTSGNMFDNIFDIFNRSNSFDVEADIHRKQGSHRVKGSDIRYDMSITLKESAFGTEKTLQVSKWVKCSRCAGTMTEDKKGLTTCPQCKGVGQVSFKQALFIVNELCNKCNGTGKYTSNPCIKCRGIGRERQIRTLFVKIPQGADTNSRLRLSGEGDVGINGGPNGDLYVLISVITHPYFKRRGLDIFCKVNVKFATLALGGEIEVETLYGKEKMTIPQGTQPGQMFTLGSRGIQRLNSQVKGNQIVEIAVEIPKNLTDKQKQLIKDFDAS